MQIKYIIFVFTLILTFGACQQKPTNVSTFEMSDDWRQQYEVQQGIEIELVAAEPMLEAPVALDFDLQGRMWVVEMIGYMRTIDGSGEEEPCGSIIILEDTDGDGKMDDKKVFMDNLILPRAILLYENGILYSEPPNLWFVEVKNDRPGQKILIDSLYAEGGNVEHQANGLLLNLDNWIYNAKSNARYRKQNGNWEKELTGYRGQWGITNDNEGRIYYDDNSNQFKGDYFHPQLTMHNEYLKPRASTNIQIVEDQKVFPLHATAINRGYNDGQLHPDGKPVNFTSSCGPVVYRGGLWGDDYEQNSFVCGPEVNLIKRNTLDFKSTSTDGSQTLNKKEFIASTDEGFRPVNIFNGPDGNLYATDMHRGIIQHKSYMTEYLREKTIKRGLDSIVGMGRIMKIKKANTDAKPFVEISKKSTEELISLLAHQNGWVRDRAQRMLIYKGVSESQMESLFQLTQKVNDKNYEALHALWTLEGINKLSEEKLQEIISNANSTVTAYALYILGEKYPDTNDNKWLNILESVIKKQDDKSMAYALFCLGRLNKLDADKRYTMMLPIIDRFSDAKQITDVAISGLGDEDQGFFNYLKKERKEIPKVWKKAFASVLKNRQENKPNYDLTAPKIYTDDRTQAMLDYRTYCATCHGLDGEGREKLAPPLNGSEYVGGDPDQLILITLHGLKGPIEVAGQIYEMNAVMPGLATNEDLSDETLAGILNFIRNGFATAGADCKADRILALRSEKPADDMWTVSSLAKKIEELD